MMPKFTKLCKWNVEKRIELVRKEARKRLILSDTL